MPGVSLGWQNTVVPEPASVMRTPGGLQPLGQIVDVVHVERHVVHAAARSARA